MNSNGMKTEEGENAFIIAVAVLWLVGAAVTTFFVNRHSASDVTKGNSGFTLGDIIFGTILGFPLMIVVWPIVAIWMACNRD